MVRFAAPRLALPRREILGLTALLLAAGCSGEEPDPGGRAPTEGADRDDAADPDRAPSNGASEGSTGPEGDGSDPTGGEAEGASGSPDDGVTGQDPSEAAPGEQDPSAPEGGDPALNSGTPDDPNAAEAPEGATPSAEPQAPHEFTRLTRAEYRATITSALGFEPDLTGIPEDGRVGPFTSNVEVFPDPVHPYLLAAEAIAAEAIPAVLPVCASGDAAGCFDDRYAPVLERLFRRPLTASERTASVALFDDLVAGGTEPEEASRAVLGAALVAPDFLFRASLGTGSETQLRSWLERISYTLWDAPADLPIAAVSGDAAPWLTEQSLAILGDPRAVPVVSRFLAQWLDVDTDLRSEAPAFATSPEYLELLSFAEAAIANDTKVTSFIAGAEGSAGLGLIGQELFAASTRHPDTSRRVIFRGLLVRRALLCQDIPAPSADLVALAGEVGDRTVDDRCAGCHLLLDPVGAAFAALDPDAEGQVPAATLNGHPELEGEYADLPALLTAISTSQAYAECFSEHWLGFFLERPRSSLDPTWVATLADAIRGGAGLGTLLAETLAIVADPSLSTPWCEGP